MTRELNDAHPETGAEHPLRKWAGIVYLLQILSFAFGGITLIVGVVINYLMRSEVQGSWLESHFTWQILTFWYSAVLVFGGIVTLPGIIGYFLLILAAIYLIYRVFRGWSRWNINEPIEQSIV